MDERREKARLIFASFALGILAGVSLLVSLRVDDEGVKALTGMFAIIAGTGSAFAGRWAALISTRRS